MSGLVCPSCEGRFRAGFTRCAGCKVDLVDEDAFKAAGIACYVGSEADESEAIATKIGVFVAEDDLARVGVVMKKRFEASIAAEGVGMFKTEAIDVGAAEVECPACGHKGALTKGECADCGLFLGDPEA